MRRVLLLAVCIHHVAAQAAAGAVEALSFGGGGGGRCRTDSDCGFGMCCAGGFNPFPLRRLLADDTSLASSTSFDFAGSTASASLYGGGGFGGFRQCRPMGSEGDSCDGFYSCPCRPGLQCVSDFGGFGFGGRRCRRFGGGGGGGFCNSNSDCPSGCCRRSGFYGGTCGRLGQVGDACSTFSWGTSCPCAAGLVCQGGLFGFGDGRCARSGGGGGGGFCFSHSQCGVNEYCRRSRVCGSRFSCTTWDSIDGTCPGTGGGIGGCALMFCPPGTRCEETTVYCITFPCPPIARCVPTYIVGRPFSTDKGYVMSALMPLSSPTLNVSSTENVLLMPDEQHVLAASHWSRMAMMEHASVASFARFSVELMALGAPLSLLHAAHQAAQDEVRHAQLALSLANKFGNTKFVLGDFPFSPAHFEFGNISDVAQATALEGCVEETIAALVAAVQAEHFNDPATQAALRELALEEASHSALAWASIKWMVTKSPSIREKVAAVIHSSRPDSHSGPVVVSPLASLGMLGEDHIAQLRDVGYRKIVVPTAISLGLIDSCEEQGEDLPEAASLRSYLAKSLE